MYDFPLGQEQISQLYDAVPVRDATPANQVTTCQHHINDHHRLSLSELIVHNCTALPRHAVQTETSEVIPPCAADVPAAAAVQWTRRRLLHELAGPLRLLGTGRRVDPLRPGRGRHWPRRQRHRCLPESQTCLQLQPCNVVQLLRETQAAEASHDVTARAPIAVQPPAAVSE